MMGAVLNLVLAVFDEYPYLDLLYAGTNLALAAVAAFVPWRRWNPLWQLLLLPLQLLNVGYSTVTFGGFETGNAPYLVLVHVWIALNFPRWVTLATAPLTAASYLAALLYVEPAALSVAQCLILLLVCVLVGLAVTAQLAAQRRDRDRIAQVERWRAALTATLAHDLRSPLATMQTAVEMVREESDEMSAAERDRLLGSVQRQITRINRLSTSLLDMERIDTDGTLRLDLAPVRLVDAVAEAVEAVGGAGVAVQVPPELTVEVDPERLQQMLINLVGNALRHGRAPVVVRAEDAAGWVSIEVRDHGPGIPPEVRRTLFTRFGADGAHGDTVGLGLWIVDQLARAHGGRVRHEPAQPGARLILLLRERVPSR
ncbi:hypothetical protein GCM10010124_21840 [Pilimelia terevasa]|uniref:histidine kinase n=1 Tax=Pilimelia terevasa TaxID=53372 RepID=A0A8J3BQH9_9ACTN|nr:hypothetical protein GCM10010124_21840 [Pilimelia terevasa]